MRTIRPLFLGTVEHGGSVFDRKLRLLGALLNGTRLIALSTAHRLIRCLVRVLSLLSGRFGRLARLLLGHRRLIGILLRARLWRLNHISLICLLTLRPFSLRTLGLLRTALRLLGLRLFRLLLAFLPRLGLFRIRLCRRLCCRLWFRCLIGILLCARFWRLDRIALICLLTLRPFSLRTLGLLRTALRLLSLRLFRLLLAFLARLGLFGLICIRLCLLTEIGGLLGVLLTPLRPFTTLTLICLLLTALRALGVRLLGTLFTLAGLRPFTTLTLICLLLATLGTFTLWLFCPLLALAARTFSSFALISLRLAALRKLLALCRNLLLHPNDTGRRRLHRSEIHTGRQGIGRLHQQWQGQNRRRHAGEQSGFHRHDIFLLLAFVPRCSRRPQ
ncbi:hypothetical protein [Rhizobium sp. ZW T2_16]|uniref:hypothetical protein n=1 Tax=Rhizobium sp. ZW T2_16 TaxID=3378083 RepID=UPI003853031F